MVVIAACLALVAVGVVMAIKWSAGMPQAPTQLVPGTGRPLQRDPEGLLEHVLISLSVGPTAAVLAAGAGGRLVMRLLAATSPEAKGALTEAEEVVGRITAGGTLSFIFFATLVGGIVSGVLHALASPALPAGRAGGVALGLLLLVLAGPRIEPLVPTNPDFGLVGPAWLSLLAFTTLALFQGMLMVAFAARARTFRGVAPHRWRPWVIAVARIAVAGALLMALPGFVKAVVDIARAA